MGQVCGPPFQRAEISSRVAGGVLGSQVSHLVLHSLLLWQEVMQLPQAPGLGTGAGFPSGPGLLRPGDAFSSAGAGRASSSGGRRARGTSWAPAQPVAALRHAATSSWGCREKRRACTPLSLEQGRPVPCRMLVGSCTDGREDGWWCFASAVQRLLWGRAVPAQQPPARRTVTAKGAQTLPEGRRLGGYWAAPLSARAGFWYHVSRSTLSSTHRS